MPSSARRGSYYKLRTKRWLEAQGYQVGYMERVLWIPAKRPGQRPIPVKVDQFGADLLAISGMEIVFVQVRGGASGAKQISSALKKFAEYVFPPSAQRWVVAWPLRAHEPEVVDAAMHAAEVARCDAAHAHDAPKKRLARKEGGGAKVR